MITIGVSGREFCLDIPVIDDEVLEDTETYTLSLTTTDDDVTVATPTASLVILDTSDGNNIYIHMQFLCLSTQSVNVTGSKYNGHCCMWFTYIRIQIRAGITIAWEQSMYIVAEEDLEQLVCATIIGQTEIFPRVSFMTTTSGSDTGQYTSYALLALCIVRCNECSIICHICSNHRR